MRLTYTDSSHRYRLDGTPSKSASGAAKITADDFALEQWEKRMVAVGMTVRPDLAERVAVDLTNREAIQAVCDDAKEAAKANNAANRGSQRHRVLELTLLGQTDEFVTEQQRQDGRILDRTLDRYSLEPMLDRVEQFVVWPQIPICGRYDCILKYGGTPAMFDLKSGRSAVDYPHSTVTQLALYAYAPKTSKTITRKGDSWMCEDWTTMPDGMDLDVGYVILVGDDDEVGTLYALDLKHGYRAATAAMEIVAWRREHNYGRNLAQPVVPATEALAEAEAAPEVVDANTTSGATRLAAQVEARKATEARHPSPTPPARGPDEGPPATPQAFDDLAAAYQAATPAGKEWFKQLVAQAREGGVDFRQQGHQTARRYWIYRGLLDLAASRYVDRLDVIVVGLAEEAANTSHNGTPPGVAVGSMDAAQAAVFSKLVDAYID
jgi:hypothetical protein